MFYSIYPTHTKEVLNKITAQANRAGVKSLFTSLHLPEYQALSGFLDILKEYHETQGFSFHADISPLSLQLLDVDYSALDKLKAYGIQGIRLDFGVDYEQVSVIAGQGFQVSVNASTLNKEMMVKVRDIPVLGWHNFYLRPYTGLSQAYFMEQNRLARTLGIETLLAFVPGEKYRRPPLGLGLPTLEKHRNTNPYVAYVELSKKWAVDIVGVAEGILEDETLEMILAFEKDGLISIPVNTEGEMGAILPGQTFTVRKEETDFTWRLENTRRFGQAPLKVFDQPKESALSERGGIYMEGRGYSRYQGEIHVCHTDTPVPLNMHKIGQIPKEFIDLTALLQNSPKIRFVEGGRVCLENL